MPTVITHDNSVFTTGINVDAFNGNSALATDALTVNAARHRHTTRRQTNKIDVKAGTRMAPS